MSERDGYQHGVPCWVDTWQPAAEPAIDFYSELFGWDVARGETYSMCRLRGRDVAAIGAPLPEAMPSAAWTTYIWVDSADEVAGEAEAAGGQIVAETFDSLDGGRLAIVADPAGAVFGVWEPGEHRGAQLVNEPGAWSMSALRTRDTDAAAAFYGSVFGWETEPFEQATMFRLPGFVGGEAEQPVPRDVVAVMVPQPEGHAHWNADFWVDDADGTAAAAARLGGSVAMAVTESPVGKTALLADQHGATFSVSELALG